MVPHTHPYYELHIIKRGNHNIILDETAVHLHSGNSLLVFPNSDHYYEYTEEAILSNNISFYIEKNKKEQSLDYYTPFLKHLQENSGFVLLNNANIIDYMTKLNQYKTDKTPLLHDYGASILKLIFMGG